MALAAVLALAVDMPIARACRPHPTTQRSVVPRDLHKLLSLGETYAHGIGVTAIAISLAVCRPGRRREALRVLAASLGAGLVADVAKFLLLARTRPNATDLDLGVFDTFVAFCPLASARFADTPFTRDFQSFPSAHSAVAAGITVALVRLFPHGRIWFVSLAAIAMAQRIDSGAHYLSDTLAGAAIGCVVGMLAMRWTTRLSPVSTPQSEPIRP